MEMIEYISEAFGKMEITTISLTILWFTLSMICGVIGVNSQQVYRPGICGLLCLFALAAFRNISNQKLGLQNTEHYAMLIGIYIPHMCCLLLIEKYELPNKNRTSIDWRGGYKMLFNARYLGTPRVAPCVLPNPKSEVSAGDFTSDREEYATDRTKKLRTFLRSPRAIFLRNRVLSLLAVLVVSKAYEIAFRTLSPLAIGQLTMYDFVPSKQTFLRRITSVTTREIFIRGWIMTYWILFSVMIYNSIHDGLALFFVGIGLDAPEDWPPLFGNVSEATSVRNFWAKFWHKLVYRAYTGFGIWTAKNVLRFPRNSWIGKVYINMFVLVMSGAVHAAAVRQLGFTCGWGEEIGFYFNSFLAMMVEEVVLKTFAMVTGGYKLNQRLSNILGYMWVLTWLFLTIPKSQFPKLWCIPKGYSD